MSNPTYTTPPSSPPGSPREPGAPIKSNVLSPFQLREIIKSLRIAPGRYHLLGPDSGPDGESYWVYGNAITGWYINTKDGRFHHLQQYPNLDGTDVLYSVTDQTNGSWYLARGPNGQAL